MSCHGFVPTATEVSSQQSPERRLLALTNHVFEYVSVQGNENSHMTCMTTNKATMETIMCFQSKQDWNFFTLTLSPFCFSVPLANQIVQPAKSCQRVQSLHENDRFCHHSTNEKFFSDCCGLSPSQFHQTAKKRMNWQKSKKNSLSSEGDNKKSNLTRVGIKGDNNNNNRSPQYVAFLL